MYRRANSPTDFRKPNQGLRREGFRSHFLLFIFDTIMMAGLIACGVAGVVMMDGERFTTPPFYIASFLSATCLISKATVGGCFSVHGLYVRFKPAEPETGLVIVHLVVSVVSIVGYFISIVVFGVSEVLGSCDTSSYTPGCSSKAGVYKGLGALTLILILISICLSCFGIYLFLRFGKEFGVSPYKNMKKSKSIKRQEARGSATRSISVHHNELNDAADFM